MKLVINLLKKSTTILFVCFLIQEVISLICILILCIFLLQKNDQNVESISFLELKEVSNSFNQVFIKQLYSIQSDLLLLASHASIMKETQTPPPTPPPNKTSSVVLNKNSNFYKKYSSSCLEDGETFETSSIYQNYSNTDAIRPGAFLILQHLKKKYDTPPHLNEEKHIDALFNELGLTKMSYYKNKKASNIDNETNIGLCYILSMLKSITIRDFTFERLPFEYALITKRAILRYPPTIQTFDLVVNYIFYDKNQKDCDSDYYPKCVRLFTPLNGVLYPNSIHYLTPLRIHSKTVGQSCISLPLIDDPDAVICLKYELNMIAFDLTLLEHSIDFALISVSDSDIEILYVMDKKYEIFNSAYSSPNFGKYSLGVDNTDNKKPISLFHLLYYHMFDFQNNDHQTIDMIIKEYEENLNIIMPMLRRYLLDINLQELITDVEPFEFTITQTYATYNINQKGEYYHRKNNFYQDKFQYLITPIILDTSNEQKGTNRLIYFSFVVNRNEITIKKNDLYHLLSVKALNYFIFGVGLILMNTLVFYFGYYQYNKFLLFPIAKYKEDLSIILNDVNNLAKNSVSRDKSSHSQNNILNSLGDKTLGFENNSEVFQFQNLDTKNVEYSIMFLKRILLMKYSNHIKYEEKATLYEELLVHLQKYPIEYIKCLFIVAINLFKSKRYPQAIEKLNEVRNKLKNQITKISMSEDTKISSNLSYEYKSYINEFSQLSDFLNPIVQKSFNLHMMFQSAFYVIGMVDWVWFKELKKNSKRKETGGSVKKKEIAQMDLFLLEKGIKALTNAFEINDLLKTNLIRNIWISLMLGKCAYEKGEYQKANWYIQESFVQLIDFNNYLITSRIPVNEKAVIMVNGVLLQKILYNFGKILIKIKKNKSACEVFVQCIEISIFKIERIQCNCLRKLAKLFTVRNLNESKILQKLSKRQNQEYIGEYNKSIVILTSFDFLNNFSSIEELKDSLIKYILKTLNPDLDNVGYFEIGQNCCKIIKLSLINTFCEEFQKKHKAHQLFVSDSSFNYVYQDQENSPLKKEKSSVENNHGECSHIIEGIQKAINMFDEAPNKNSQDKYIFLFGFSKYINFCESEDCVSIREKLHKDNISLYVFCFDNEVLEVEFKKIVNFIRKSNLIEGILFNVNTFKIIKHAIQNITTKGEKKPMMISYEDVNKIF